jgi:nicotinamide mononucleotide adenylyltransferase
VIPSPTRPRGVRRLTRSASVNMCTRAADETSHWLMVDAWEAFKTYQRTALVLDHFDHEINVLRGGVRTASGEARPVRIMLLAGSDLIATMSEPGVWSEADVRLRLRAALYLRGRG